LQKASLPTQHHNPRTQTNQYHRPPNTGKTINHQRLQYQIHHDSQPLICPFTWKHLKDEIIKFQLKKLELDDDGRSADTATELESIGVIDTGGHHPTPGVRTADSTF
jgi:hypothetical protein